MYARDIRELKNFEDWSLFLTWEGNISLLWFYHCVVVKSVLYKHESWTKVFQQLATSWSHFISSERLLLRASLWLVAPASGYTRPPVWTCAGPSLNPDFVPRLKPLFVIHLGPDAIDPTRTDNKASVVQREGGHVTSAANLRLQHRSHMIFIWWMLLLSSVLHLWWHCWWKNSVFGNSSLAVWRHWGGNALWVISLLFGTGRSSRCYFIISAFLSLQWGLCGIMISVFYLY